MRVISGDAKGRPLFFPPKSRARPTSDMIKEAFFNILAPVTGKIFLDVFAGSGSVGIEALSRGAASVAFIEKDAAHCDYIKKNLLQCGFTEKYDIFSTEVKKAIPILQKKGVRFDIIFADPPYEAGLVEETGELFAAGKLLASDSMIIFQHSVREEPDWKQGWGLTVLERRKYGDTLLTFLKKIKV
ncbi:MAG: 16S rRNA (guanine(966)-N(2))-methyltransferase RsmD [Deltaproteobacteria bacterium]|nr:16S rRNA (guanine(966)-N(2))-methyltransferase RsmD [Deltaproteobacteria bacterium]